MKIYRVYEKEILGGGYYKTVDESFYTLDKLVRYLNSKKAYFKNINEPITETSILENITDTYCVDVIIPKKDEESIWDMMGLSERDTLLWIVELTISQ